MKTETTNAFSHCLQRIAAAVLLLLFMGITAHAIPAKPGQTRLLTLADGTTVSARLVGDEFCHYWMGQDGKAYKATADGYEAVDLQAVRSRAGVKRSAANKQRASRLRQAKKEGTYGNYTGKKKGIVILVNFKDVKFKATRADYDNIANTPNYNSGQFKGSMYDYFYAQSEGRFELNFDVVGPYTLSQNMSYYGSNDQDGNDKRPGAMVIEAVKAANAEVNFADYDWDGDGYVDQVYVVYAGQGEATGGAESTIWPHAYSLTEEAYYGDGSGKQWLDGVYVDTYACGNELNGSGKTDGIGTMCHEFSHCLGYPDFYDIDYSGGQGMAEWDLMASGSYNGDGYLPAGYTAYERWMAGWTQPIELTSTQTVEGMKALQEGGEAYIIYNKGNSNEYFILENRQHVGWDAGLPGKGMLIVHVDYDANVWQYNQPNDDPAHQRMTWIPADNQYQYYTYMGSKYYTLEGMATDTYPHGNVKAFGKSTTPAAKLYNKNTDGTYYLDTSVEDITQNADGTIGFRFVATGNVAPPTFSPKGGRYTAPLTVTIGCATEGAAIHYTTDGTNPTADSQLYEGAITVTETTTLKAIAVDGDDMSEVATERYVIAEDNGGDGRFVRLTSVQELQEGNRCIIACASKSRAAAQLNGTYLNSVSLTAVADTLHATEETAIFILEGSQDEGWTLKNEATGKYLYAIEAKKLGYTDSDGQAWTLSDTDGGVTLSFNFAGQNFGTMLYNSVYARFNTYTSNPSTSMIQANLYMEHAAATGPANPDTLMTEKLDILLAFSAKEAEATIGEEFTAPALTLEPALEFADIEYSSSNTDVATVDEGMGTVYPKAEGTTVITATFAGNDNYNPATASYTLTVKSRPLPKCEMPTISYDRGRLVFDSATDDATFVYEIAHADSVKGSAKEVMLSAVFVISVYATKDGHADSDVATATIGWRDGAAVIEGFTSVTLDDDEGTRGDVNSDGTVDVADIATVIDIMAAMARATKAEE